MTGVHGRGRGVTAAAARTSSRNPTTAELETGRALRHAAEDAAARNGRSSRFARNRPAPTGGWKPAKWSDSRRAFKAAGDTSIQPRRMTPVPTRWRVAFFPICPTRFEPAEKTLPARPCVF